jgi:histone deacetylase 11
VGGGFHHCSSDRGGGFCAYADLTLLIKNLFTHHPDRVKKVLIVDLDAHQVKPNKRKILN